MAVVVAIGLALHLTRGSAQVVPWLGALASAAPTVLYGQDGVGIWYDYQLFPWSRTAVAGHAGGMLIAGGTEALGSFAGINPAADGTCASGQRYDSVLFTNGAGPCPDGSYRATTVALSCGPAGSGVQLFGVVTGFGACGTALTARVDCSANGGNLCVALPSATPSAFATPADPCYAYTALNDRTREVTDTAQSPADGYPACDVGLAPGWYRLTDGAFNFLPVTNTGANGNCNAYWGLYVSSGHYPLVSGATATVAVSGAGDFVVHNGNVALPAVTIKNCGGFFVYSLSAVPMTNFRNYPDATHPCAYRFCTTNVAPAGFVAGPYSPAPTPSQAPTATRTPAATQSPSRSPASPSPTQTPLPPGVVWLAVDGAPASGAVVAGGSSYFAYTQPLPYAVQLTLNSLSGDADLFVGPAPPSVGGAFAHVASSTNGGQQVDAVGCVPAGPAASASGDNCSSCFGPLATTTWYAQVTGWTAATFTLNATSMLSAPLFVGSPQPTPGAVSADAQLALCVTAAGVLDVAGTSSYWELGVPLGAASRPTYISLRITGPTAASDADLLVGTTPPFGANNVDFNSAWASTNAGDDWVTVPPLGAAAAARIYVAVKAFAAPVSYTLLATSVGSGAAPPSGAGGSPAATPTPVAAIVAPVVVVIVAVAVMCVVLAARRKKREQQRTAVWIVPATPAAAARAPPDASFVFPPPGMRAAFQQQGASEQGSGPGARQMSPGGPAAAGRGAPPPPALPVGRTGGPRGVPPTRRVSHAPAAVQSRATTRAVDDVEDPDGPGL